MQVQNVSDNHHTIMRNFSWNHKTPSGVDAIKKQENVKKSTKCINALSQLKMRVTLCNSLIMINQPVNRIMISQHIHSQNLKATHLAKEETFLYNYIRPNICRHALCSLRVNILCLLDSLVSNRITSLFNSKDPHHHLTWHHCHIFLKGMNR